MAHAHLREQVYGLCDLAESNDLDSDIASLADWLRLGALTWYSLATGQHRPWRLKLEPPLQSRASTGFRLTSWPAKGALPAQLQPDSDVQSYIYHMIHTINIKAGGVAVRAALRCAWDPWFESRYYAYFCKMFYTRIYAYILTCTQIHSVYTRIHGLAAVFMCSYKYIMRYTESYLFVCWYTQYIPVYTDL
jgi:hypothetical protein